MNTAAQIATITATREVVTIVSVSGGWTTIASNGGTRKIRNGALSDHRDAPKPTVEAAKPISTERKNGKVDPLYLQFYGKYTATRADGTTVKSLDNGDATARILRDKTLEETYEAVALLTGGTIGGLKARYAHLNPGMQRMNLGNIARKAFKIAA
jgi:hypothetical protein